jgi:hypothetical protein
VVSGSLPAVLIAEPLVASLDKEWLAARLALPLGTMDAGDLHGEVNVNRGKQI